MLHRSTSSRRRRASRSGSSNSPQRSSTSQTRAPRPTSASSSIAAASSSSSSTSATRGRRASVAVGVSDSPTPPPVRSPRNSISVPIESPITEELPDVNRSPRGSIGGGQSERSPRNSLVPDSNRSPRNSLIPECNRSPRNSITPEVNRSPRNSIVPEPTRTSPRNSIVPEPTRISPKNSLVPDVGRSPRNSLVPDVNRSPRNSLVPDGTRIARNSLVPDYNRSPRNSLVPDPNRSPRNSLVPDSNRSPRNSLVPDSNRSPRNSLYPDSSRSPRNSLIPDFNRSPRNSLVPDNFNRSPRNSLVPDAGGRSPRGSICSTGAGLVAATFDLAAARSPRGSIIDATLPDCATGSSRISGSGLIKTGSPYRMSVSTKGAQINLGYNSSGNIWSDADSRRASSNVSQVSADDRRYLCEHTKLNADVSLGLTAYGSVVYQLKDANMEASGSCDFMFRALRIVYKTMVVTVVLICLTSFPIIMFIMGVHYLRDCPREPHIPVYMIVGGILGTFKMLWMLWCQIKSRQYQRLDLGTPVANIDDGVFSSSAGSRLLSSLLTVFLLAWFVLGNYWILHILWPEYRPKSIYDPNTWCDKTLYIFSLVHLCVMYSLFGVLCIVGISFMCCQLFSCPLVIRYK